MRKKILIVGADSAIGSRACCYFEQLGYDVFGTTRRKNLGENRFQLDLSVSDPLLPEKVFDVVVMCASITGLAACEADPEGTARVNVHGTLKLIDEAAKHGAQVIFLSSTAVFDGSKPFYAVSDSTHPKSVYGLQKQAVEARVDLEQVAILRLTKVVHQDMPLLKMWREQLNRGKLIHAYVDQKVSPITLDEVCTAIRTLIEKRSVGVYHLGGECEISYFEFANHHLSEFWAQIQPIVSDTSRAPSHASLQTSTLFRSASFPNKRSYSAEGQDQILEAIFRNVLIGFYLEVGANHPVMSSNTLGLYLKGWSGLCIDGNAAFRPAWSEYRPRDRFMDLLVSDVVREVEFVCFPDDTMNTINSETASRYQGKFVRNEVRSEKRLTTTLNSICEQYLHGREIHLLSIDVEGEDLNVLKGVDLKRFLPGVLLIETKGFSFSLAIEHEIVSYLYEFGYRMIAKTPLDAFFVHPSKDYLDWIPRSLMSTEMGSEQKYEKNYGSGQSKFD
jgi:dTDP-4-dehydrorhamnose reductase